MKKIGKLTKIFLSFLIALVGIISTSKVSAASYPSKLTNVKHNSLLNYTGWAALYYKTSDNYKVFCTTFNVPNVGTSCSLSKTQWSVPVQAGVAAIIDKYNTNKTKQNYYYSEIAINEFLYYYAGKNSVNKISKSTEMRNLSAVKPFYNAAVSAYNNANKKYSLKLNTASSSLKFSSSGNYYLSEKITVSAVNGSVGNYTATVSGATKAEIYKKSGNSFYVRVPKSSIKVGSSVNIKVTVNSSLQYHIAKNFTCNGVTQNLTPNVTTNNTVKANVSKSGTITLKGNTINIIKKDSETKQALAGATLVVKNANGKTVDSWVSDVNSHALKNLVAGNYTLEEAKAPKGYELSKEVVKFVVKNDNKTITVEMLNKKLKNPVEISKKDITTGKELPGATLVVKDANGKIVDSWVSTNEPHKIKNLASGNYTLTETIAPDGYRLSSATVKFTVKGDGTTTKVVMNNTLKNKTQVSIIKKDSETKQALAGATLVVKDASGKIVDSWVSDTNSHALKNLAVGDYTLEETKAPVGYKLSKEAIKFSVKNDDKTITVEMLNTKTVNPVEISKQDTTTGKELPGATLVVKDASGKIVDSWVSTNEPHKIKNLTPGNYTLTETIAPDGYRLSSETVKFTVKGDGTTTKVVMNNTLKNKTQVSIIKKDSGTKQALAGATLVVKDASGKIVDSWVSDTNSHALKNLAVGDYTLEETKAPEGYELSKEVIKFSVKNDDKTITVEMLNSKFIENKVEISKQDIATGKELPGATLVVKDANGKTVDSWVSTNEPHIIKSLTPGNYTLTETIAPDGYRLSSETVKFTVKGDGTTTKVVMYNSKKDIPKPSSDKSKFKVEISKQDITTKEELPGATLIIKDASGNEVDRWVSTNIPHYIELFEGEYTLTEIQAPEGYDLSYEVVKFTVAGDNEKVVMYNSKTPNTADKNILFMISFMSLTAIGVGYSIFKMR